MSYFRVLIVLLVSFSANSGRSQPPEQCLVSSQEAGPAAREALKLWSAADEDAAANASTRAADFLKKFAALPEHRVLNTGSFFAELAQTSPDARVANDSQRLAREYLEGLANGMKHELKRGSFGQLLGTKHDVLDALELLSAQAAVGVKIVDDARSLLAGVSKEYKLCRSCSRPAATDDPSDLVDSLLSAYTLDEAHVRFGALFPVKPGLLAEALAAAQAPFGRDLSDAGPASLFQVRETFHSRDGASLRGPLAVEEKEDAWSGADPVSKILLATHIVFVLNGYDRFRESVSEAPEVLQWLRRAWPYVWRRSRGAEGDNELLGEVVAAYRAFGCTGSDDAMVRAGTRALERAQRVDGSWGTDARFNKTLDEMGTQGLAYDVLHHVWTPTSALRPRRLLGGNTSGDTFLDKFAAHLRKMSALSRSA